MQVGATISRRRRSSKILSCCSCNLSLWEVVEEHRFPCMHLRPATSSGTNRPYSFPHSTPGARWGWQRNSRELWLCIWALKQSQRRSMGQAVLQIKNLKWAWSVCRVKVQWWQREQETLGTQGGQRMGLAGAKRQ